MWRRGKESIKATAAYLINLDQIRTRRQKMNNVVEGDMSHKRKEEGR